MNKKYSFPIAAFALVLSLFFLFPTAFKIQAKSIVIESKVLSTPSPVPRVTPQGTPPPAPQINVAPEVYYPLDETLYVEGKAEPKSKVELFFEKPGSNPVRQTVEANSNGEWFLSQKLELASGEWMVRAQISSDPPSDWSTPRIIQSRITGIIIAGIRIKYAPVAIVLVLLFLLGGGLLVYAILRVRAARVGAHERELQEGMERLQNELRTKDREAAGVMLEQHFSEIRDDILKELEHLEIKSNKSNRLSGDEEAHRAKLLRELREAEEAIQKKVKAIR